MHRFDELLQDCSVLFGRDAVTNRQFLETLQMSALKAAFRRRALVTHPDLFSGQAEWVRKHRAEQFIGAREAYKRLSQYLVNRCSRSVFARGRRAAAWEQRARAQTKPFSAGREGRAPATGPGTRMLHCLPGWPLRTGEFLYYSGVITFRLLITAVVWQRQQRDRIGDIARRWGWLSEEEIRKVAAGKCPGEKLGEVLLRGSWITPFQLSALLWHQRKSQRPIGRYFVERGLITEEDLRMHLADLDRHNRKFKPRPAARAFH